MTDKELLEAAAKVASIVAEWDESHKALMIGVPFRGVASMMNYEPWNPLRDDGDALRLAVKLEIDLCFGANYVIADGVQQPTVNNAGDSYASVRYAIVRAAADLAAERGIGAA